MKGTPDCKLLRPGHNVHHIQAARRRREDDVALDPESIRSTGVGSLLVRTVEGEMFLWNHRPDLVANWVAEAVAITYNEPMSLLEMQTAQGRLLVSVARRPPGPCW